MDIFNLILKIIFFIIICVLIMFVIYLLFEKEIIKSKKIGNILNVLYEMSLKSLVILFLLLVVTGMMKSCVGIKTKKTAVYTYRKNKFEDQTMSKFKKKQLERIENRQKIDITLTTVKNNLGIFFKRHKITESIIVSSKSGAGREEFCVAEKTCYYITYEPKTEKILLLQMAFKYPESKKQIDDFRNHVCLFLGMTNPNVNLSDVENVVRGLNIIPKNITNITRRNYIYQNYMYSLYYNDDYDLMIITIQGSNIIK